MTDIKFYRKSKVRGGEKSWYPRKQRLKLYPQECFLSLSLSLAIAVVTETKAQNITVGVKGGLSIATIGGSDAEEAWGSKMGFTVGVGVGIDVSDPVGVEANLLFVQRGYELSAEQAGIKLSSTLNLNYLAIPLAVKGQYPIKSGGMTIKPYAMFALEPSLLLGGSTQVCTNGNCQEGEEPEVSSFDFGIGFGAGTGITFGGGLSAGLGLRYVLGLLTLDPDGEASVMNRTLLILLDVGYSF